MRTRWEDVLPVWALIRWGGAHYGHRPGTRLARLDGVTRNDNGTPAAWRGKSFSKEGYARPLRRVNRGDVVQFWGVEPTAEQIERARLRLKPVLSR